jgi:hypothetical protein
LVGIRTKNPQGDMREPWLDERPPQNRHRAAFFSSGTTQYSRHGSWLPPAT